MLSDGSDLGVSTPSENEMASQPGPTAGPKLANPYNYRHLVDFLKLGDNYYFTTGFEGYKILGEALIETNLAEGRGEDYERLFSLYGERRNIIKDDLVRLKEELQASLKSLHIGEQHEFVLALADIGMLTHDHYYPTHNIFKDLIGSTLEVKYDEYLKAIEALPYFECIEKETLGIYIDAYRETAGVQNGHVDGQLRPLIASIIVRSDYASVARNIDINQDILDLKKSDNPHARLGLLIANSIGNDSQVNQVKAYPALAMLSAIKLMEGNRKASNAIFSILYKKKVIWDALGYLNSMSDGKYNHIELNWFEELTEEEVYSISNQFIEPTLTKSNIF